MKFRKYFTHLCELPGMIIPIVAVSRLSAWITNTGRIGMLACLRLVSVTLLVAFACGVTIKFIYYKERPKPQVHHNRWQKIDASSFPSIHTSRATIFMCVGLRMSIVIYQQHDQHITFSALILALLSVAFYISIAYSRIILKKHFFIDVVFGTLLGLVAVAFSRAHLDAIDAGFQLVSSRLSL